MHVLLSRPHDLRTWILVAIVFAMLALMAVIWDPSDLGDGLVLGSDGSVSAVWESAQGRMDDFLFGSLPTRPLKSGR